MYGRIYGTKETQYQENIMLRVRKAQANRTATDADRTEAVDAVRAQTTDAVRTQIDLQKSDTQIAPGDTLVVDTPVNLPSRSKNRRTIVKNRSLKPVKISAQKPLQISAAEANRRIAGRTQPGKKVRVLTSNQFADRIGLNPRTFNRNYLEKNKIVGWRNSMRELVFPAGQIDRYGKVPEGLDQIVSRFADGHAAWVWLTTAHSALGKSKPLTLLRKGKIELVVAVADGDSQGDFA